MDPNKIDWTKISAGVTSIAQGLAAGTDSPLDDLAASYLGPLVVDMLKKQFVHSPQGLMMAVPSSLDADAAAMGAEMAAKGLSPALISTLLTIIKAILPLFLGQPAAQ